MSTDYLYIPMTFDKEEFAADLLDFRNKNRLTQKQADEMMGVVFFQTYEYTLNDQYPTVRNFMTACNLMDKDPRKYFVLDNGRR